MGGGVGVQVPLGADGGGSPCIVGDALVHTAGGLRRAAELWASRHAPAVLTDGRCGGPAFTPATPVVRRGFRPVVRVRAREGYEIRITADHGFRSEERGWVAAGELRTGEAVRLADRGGGFGPGGSAEEGHVLGWLVGDARFTRERAVLSFYGEEGRELAGAFATAVNRVIRPGRTRAYAPVGVVEVPDRDLVTIASARLREFALARGVATGARAHLPEVVWTASRDLQVGFLQALFEADGYVDTTPGARGGIRLSLQSRELAQGVQRLLLNFAIVSRLQRERGVAGGGPRRTVRLHVRAPRFQVAITGSGVVRFSDEIGFLGEGKRSDLAAYLRSFARGPYRQRFVCRVESVREDGADWVYELTEPLTGSFVANGLVLRG